VRPLPITLCISTRNAAAPLGECIESVRPWVREIVVVDMESDDRTCEIARAAGANVVTVPAAGWAEPGRQAGIDAATQPWVLVLDADERPGPELERVAAEYVGRDEIAGVQLPRQNFWFGWWTARSGMWPDWQLRLFRRERTVWPGHRTHVGAQVSGRVVHAPARVENAIVHHSVPSLTDWVRSMNTYTSLEADRYAREDRSASLPRLLCTPLLRFAEQYVWRRGYRSGRYGLAIALLSSCYWLLAELKLWERRLTSGSLPSDAVPEPGPPDAVPAARSA
jgi:glycosyltransferase involved in cell wall biosynthesis